MSNSNHRQCRFVTTRRPLAGLIILIALSLGLSLTKANPAAAAKYHITQLDGETTFGDDIYPTINNRGQIVYFYSGTDLQPAYYQLYWNGSLTTLNIPPNYGSAYFDFPPLLLNDRGQMSYTVQDYNDGGKYKVYFLDGPGGSPQAVNRNCQSLQLNQQGQMAWNGWNDAVTDQQVYFFNNGNATPITQYNSGSGLDGFWLGPALNDNGQVVWIDRTSANSGNNLQLYQGGVTQCIYSTKNATKWPPQINNQGQIIWVEDVPSTSLYAVMLYDGGSVTQIPGSAFPSILNLQINNQGQVLWLAATYADNPNIYLYCQGKTTKVTNYQGNTKIDLGILQLSEEHTKFAPQMNNNGEIVWAAYAPNSANPALTDLTVNVYTRGQVTQLDSWTVNSEFISWSGHFLSNTWAQINDAGQVVWSRYSGTLVPNVYSDFEIYLATPVRSLGHLQLLLSD